MHDVLDLLVVQRRLGHLLACTSDCAHFLELHVLNSARLLHDPQVHRHTLFGREEAPLLADKLEELAAREQLHFELLLVLQPRRGRRSVLLQLSQLLALRPQPALDCARAETCPLSTGGRTRRVQLV